MADKIITDLNLRSSVTDDVNVPIDDTIQTYRVTMPQIFNYLRLKFGAITAIAAAGTVLDETTVVVTLNPTGSSFVQALPACASIPTGHMILFKNIATNGNTATLDADGAELIDSATTLVLNSDPIMDAVLLYNTGLKWLIF